MKALFALLLVSSAAAADDALLRCRAITDSTARLACYDAMPATAAVPPAAAPERFGLPPASTEAKLDVIESHIRGRFQGWGPNSQIELANGQVWQVTDNSRGVYDLDNPKVSIRRGMLGAFYLEIEGQNRSPKVRRLR